MLSLHDHLRHHGYHRNVTKFYHCGFNRCEHFFQTTLHLKLHLRRQHLITSAPKAVQINAAQIVNDRGKYFCSLTICSKEFDDYKKFIKHLKEHIKHGYDVSCPFQTCNKTYNVISSFTGHLSKCHRQNICSSIDNQELMVAENDDFGDFFIGNENLMEVDDSNSPPDLDLVIENQKSQTLEEKQNLFVVNTTQFYLMLESKLLVPASTIQIIVSEFNKMYEEGQEITKTKIKDCLTLKKIPHEDIDEVLKIAFSDDPFTQSFKTLKTNYKRKKMYKFQFNYVEPKILKINEEKKTFFAYVPLIETISRFFTDKSLNVFNIQK